MKDFLGNEMEIGDKIVYVNQGSSSGWLVKGTIIRFTSKMVVIGTGLYAKRVMADGVISLRGLNET